MIRRRALYPVGYSLACVLFAAMAAGQVAASEPPAASNPLEAVVGLESNVPAEARTAAALGTKRQGSGVVIDDAGLVLTIGYLILEAESIELNVGGSRRVSADVLAYDHETGLGLVRASRPLGVSPIPIGSSDPLVRGRQVVVASAGGYNAAIGAYVVSRRDFAGWWEYLLEKAIFTAPAHPHFGGAALIDGDGRLVGVGSLMVPDAAEENEPLTGNMFVPIDALKPILADLIAEGRAARPSRPWLGLYPQEIHGRLFVARVPRGGPADRAGLKPGDLVLGVAGKAVSTLPGYYRALWGLGSAGVEVPLSVLRGNRPTDIRIRSIDRMNWFRRPPSY
ncbi:MAG: S1C family serine protease [Defluviicoccus sp.]|nr:S1C family serine protease [Defluviicoccus sp.]